MPLFLRRSSQNDVSQQFVVLYSDGNKVRKLKRRHLVTSSLNRRYWSDIPYHTVYCIQYIVSFLYLSISGTYSTKMDKVMDDWRSLIVLNHLNEKSESFQVERFQNLLFCYQFLTFSVIWTSLEATKGWHVTFGQQKSEKPYIVFSLIFCNSSAKSFLER